MGDGWVGRRVGRRVGGRVGGVWFDACGLDVAGCGVLSCETDVGVVEEAFGGVSRLVGGVV